MITDVKTLSPHPSLEQYRTQAKDLLKAWKRGDPEAGSRVRKFHVRPGAAPALAGARLVLAREHGFAGWGKFARHIEALNRADSAESRFELAADAVVAGDVAALRGVLREDPGLIRARSSRAHHATLLHYVGANGVEDFRQRTPKNAVAVLRVLLDAGAEVDAEANMYHRDTTLVLVATSLHPLRAGVQTELMEVLLAAGAAVDPHARVVVDCLANGRGQAAAFLAARGASLDLEGAAGVGRLDLVMMLLPQAARPQIDRGFLWACEYGHDDVVEFLLANGANLRAQADAGQTGLHMAVIGGRIDTVRLLLARGAPPEAKNRYGGTAVSQARWCLEYGDPAVDYAPIVELLTASGAQRM